MEQVNYKQTKAEIFNRTWWVNETNPEVCKNTLDNLLHSSEFTVLNFIEHHFSKQGYTCLWLLAESHLAVHTFPEENKCYIELSSCNQSKLEVFEVLIQKLF